MSNRTYFQYTPPPKTAWDELPMPDKADIMKSCVRNGIITLQDIRTAYNNYAAGRDILEGIPDYQANTTEFGNFLAGGGKIKYSKPYYSYDDSGQKVDNTLNYNAILPEVVVIPDSKKSPAQRNADERFRQKYLRDYAEQQNSDYTTRQAIASQREWENSLQKKALDFGMAAAQGIGMASDVVSPFFGGIPTYSGLKGAQALDKATQTNELADYADAALWLSPMLTIAGKKVYDTAKPTIKSIFQEGTPAAQWAETEAMQRNIGNGNISPNSLEATEAAAEKGVNKLLSWIKDPFYKQRLENEPMFRYADDIINEAEGIVKNANPKFDKALLELDPTGQTYGITRTRPAKTVLDLGDYKVFDLNTGLDLNIASDLGTEAEDTTLHELLHYLTVNSKGIPESTATMQIVDKGWMNPLESVFGSVGKNIMRGKKWQNYIIDQNDALLPKYDAVVEMIMRRPEEAKAALMKVGRSEAEAQAAVESLKNRYAYWADIQEQRAHLQELFISKIRPHLKNPNDAVEIETFLTEHPEILESSTPYKYIQEVRPGSLKQYANYFASALGTIPFILNSRSNE